MGYTILEILDYLFSLQDKAYAEFQSKLIPTVDKEKIIGVRTPELKKYAKQVNKMEIKDAFLNSLPHQYFEEDQLHAFVISEEKDFEKCIKDIEAFLPYINNWATCDQLKPKVFAKNKDKLYPYICKWIKSDKTYEIRFAIGMLMSLYLDKDFDNKYVELVGNVKSEEYYVNMMIAWYFATALAKQYDSVISVLENNKLDKWVHNKTIQKAVESYRVTDEHKEYLRSLRVK
ncbi:MAG: DNA alkylation repair protein [Lachnospiraceae bacterium]|nr:DNA alkylation repair protein [Lachnospiraceae bacterium]MBQ2407278.1 DNA alkylation repair protein [Lachnospiraceae bacterium]